MVANKKMKKKFLNLKSIFAKANPASEQKNNTAIVIVVEIMKEFNNDPKKLIRSKTLNMFSTKLGPGNNAGGILFTSEFVLEPITNIQ